MCVCVDADLFGDSEEISFPDLLNTGADLIAVCFSTSDYSFFTCSYKHHTTHSLYTSPPLLPSSSPSSSPSLSLSSPLSVSLSLPLHLPPSLAISRQLPFFYTLCNSTMQSSNGEERGGGVTDLSTVSTSGSNMAAPAPPPPTATIPHTQRGERNAQHATHTPHAPHPIPTIHHAPHRVAEYV